MSRFATLTRPALAALVVAGLLAGCAPRNGQSSYSAHDVGVASVVKFGTVLAARQVEINHENTGTGAAAGGLAGAVAGANIGSGNGQLVGLLGGLIVGAVAGAVAEQELNDRVGIEYTITVTDGTTLTIVQEQAQGDVVFQPGASVMVQTRGTYNRVLPSSHLPDTIAKPKDVKIAP
ncbi:MAG TPA: hypothetical protein VEH84_16695 [Alphaproteobacteria bacterium]|nr:hypothetical protein [Alphaproteobacteria bacterium]